MKNWVLDFSVKGFFLVVDTRHLLLLTFRQTSWIYYPKIGNISIDILQFRCPRMMVKKTIIRGHSSFLPHAVGIPAASYAV